MTANKILRWAKRRAESEKVPEWEREAAARIAYGGTARTKGKLYMTVSEKDMARERRRMYLRTMMEWGFWMAVWRYVRKAANSIWRKWRGKPRELFTFSPPVVNKTPLEDRGKLDT